MGSLAGVLLITLTFIFAIITNPNGVIRRSCV
ncbi:hypothetical protein SAMN06272722_110251 [Paenibacillus sp. RU5A]|nr:hypothetical protein SAMN06272722_110251 [Paenibacillus sp. RU5A]SOC74476.1 hypothetical protein SAMN05880581_110251 [Paenibacillus sp. RU26A]SOC76664.1 hypothetical protein SAMN05880586_110251 [Paenibacillus sp. RU5M]